MADIVPPKGYKLVWHDEFDQGTEPNLNEWYYEEFPPFKFNNESQAYVAGWKDNEQLAVVNGGILSIFAKNIAGQVYSIRMNTKRNWTYGYFEARIKVPSGRGTWPAFWMLPSNFVQWPLDGEIDIMEYVGYERDTTYASIHCQAYNHVNKTNKTNESKVENAETDWHTYACKWTRNYIQMFVDGKPYFYFENDHKNNKDTWPFDAPFYIKLNLAWGGMWGGKYGMDESALPAQYQIDYVRVFQRTNDPDMG